MQITGKVPPIREVGTISRADESKKRSRLLVREAVRGERQPGIDARQNLEKKGEDQRIGPDADLHHSIESQGARISIHTLSEPVASQSQAGHEGAHHGGDGQ